MSERIDVPAAPPDTRSWSREQLVGLYERLVLIRAFEEQLHRLRQSYACE